MKSTSLVKEIKKAFQSVEYPGDELIIKDTDIYQESYNMWLAFKGHWKSVSAKVVEEYRLNFPRFTPEGFCFYLPALLIAALDPTPYEVDSFLIQDLTPPSDTDQRQRFDSTMNILSKNQKVVVKMWVNNFVEENPLLADKYTKTLAYWTNAIQPE